MSYINPEKDKFGVKVKFPERTCEGCQKFPCFPGKDKCRSNMAAYGCVYFTERRTNDWI